MADLDLTQFLPPEQSKAKKLTQGTILPILSALEQIATSYKTKGQFVGNSVQKQLEGYQQRDVSDEESRQKAIDRALKFKQIGDAETEKASKKTAAEALKQKIIAARSLATPEEQQKALQDALLESDPEQFGKLAAFPQLPSNIFIPTNQGIFSGSSKGAPNVKPLTGPEGKVLRPPIPPPPKPEKTPEQIEAEAAARARGAASVLKPELEEKIRSNRNKLTLARKQLSDVRSRYKDMQGKWYLGVASQEGQSFKKAVDAWKQTQRSLTRTAGEGSTSDFEGQLALASAPSWNVYPEVTEQAIDQLDDLVNILDSEYAKTLTPTNSSESDVTITGNGVDNVTANYKVGDTRVNNKNQTIQLQQDGTWKIIK